MSHSIVDKSINYIALGIHALISSYVICRTMKMLTTCLILAASVAFTMAAPVKQAAAAAAAATAIDDKPEKSSGRQGKSLNYYDYVQPAEEFVDYGAADGYEDADGDDYALDYDQNDLGRTLPKRKKVRRPYNSPIYYIRLPPQPYMFVPGFGYVSQPPQNPVQQFLNVPVSFVSNGKPANIYQWSGIQQFPTPAPPAPIPRPQPPAMVQRPKPKPDSTIHRLPGQFAFNGKPEDIFVLRDSYNSLYSDALQNFYP